MTKNEMKRRFGVLVMCGILPLAVACSGGGAAAEVVGGGSSLTASFTAAEPDPGANSTAMDLGGSSGDLVTVTVGVTDTNGVYGASFQVTYDPQKASYVNFSHGQFLESGGHTPTYQVDGSQSGVVFVAATRNGSVSGVNVSGTRALINLTFRVREAGQSALAFGDPRLYDSQFPPQPIAVQWFGGSLRAN